MASIASTIISLYNRIFPPTDPRITRLKRKQDEMALSVVQTRRTHSFHFLDLPPNIRKRIYAFVFGCNVVQVCSYNKDKAASTFSIDERCQLLLTNKLIYEEAWSRYYWISDWKFVKVSSLNYMAWGDGGQAKLQMVQKVILTNQDVVEVFSQYLEFFSNLKTLVIDLAPSTTMQKRPGENAKAQLSIARNVKRMTYWIQRVYPYVPRATERAFAVKFSIKVKSFDNPEYEEMMLIDMDRLTVQRNFRAVDPAPVYGFIYMPSSDAADAELSMVNYSDVDTTRFAPATTVPRRSKRRLQDIS